MESIKYLKLHVYSGMLIAFGIAFVISSIDMIPSNPWAAFGIFFGGLFIGIGLLPFDINEKYFN